MDYAASMKRFYEPTVINCLKSGTLLFMAVLLPTATGYFANWFLLTGVVALSAGTLLFSRSLARVGVDAMLVHLSQFNRAVAFLIILSALALHALALVGVTIIAVRLEMDISLVRTLASFALIAFLPVTIVGSAKILER